MMWTQTDRQGKQQETEQEQQQQERNGPNIRMHPSPERISEREHFPQTIHSSSEFLQPEDTRMQRKVAILRTPERGGRVLRGDNNKSLLATLSQVLCTRIALIPMTKIAVLTNPDSPPSTSSFDALGLAGSHDATEKVQKEAYELRTYPGWMSHERGEQRGIDKKDFILMETTRGPVQHPVTAQDSDQFQVRNDNEQTEGRPGANGKELSEGRPVAFRVNGSGGLQPVDSGSLIPPWQMKGSPSLK